MIGHVVTTGQSGAALSGLEEVAEALAQALARHGITSGATARAEYLNPVLNGYDWDALDEMAVHTHGRPMHRPQTDCIRFHLTTDEEVAWLRDLLAGGTLMDPWVRPDRHRTRWQCLVDRWTGRVTLRTVEAVYLHPDDDAAVEADFAAAFDRAVAAGRAVPDVAVTSGRLLRRRLVEVTVPAGVAAGVVHRLRTRAVAGGAR